MVGTHRWGPSSICSNVKVHAYDTKLRRGESVRIADSAKTHRQSRCNLTALTAINNCRYSWAHILPIWTLHKKSGKHPRVWSWRLHGEIAPRLVVTLSRKQICADSSLPRARLPVYHSGTPTCLRNWIFDRLYTDVMASSGSRQNSVQMGN